MGNYALNVLLHQLDKLDYAYDRFVENGDVDSKNKVAKENREKAKDLDDAIKILTANVDTGERLLNIPDVSTVVICPKCGKDEVETSHLRGEHWCINCKHVWANNAC